MSGWVLVAAAAALAVVLVVGLVLAIVRLRRSRATAAEGLTPVPSAPDPGPEGTRRDLRPVSDRSGRATPSSGVLPRDLAGPPGGLALLQLSSQFCADCRASRAVLTDVAGEHPGLTVREVDVAMRPELVRLLGIRRTPTTLVVDPSRGRAGAPRGGAATGRSAGLARPVASHRVSALHERVTSPSVGARFFGTVGARGRRAHPATRGGPVPCGLQPLLLTRPPDDSAPGPPT